MRSPSLFWRTLLLVLLLIVASLTAWLQSYRVLERVPRAQTIAQQVTSRSSTSRALRCFTPTRSCAATCWPSSLPMKAFEFIRSSPTTKSHRCLTVPLIKLIEQAIVAKLGAEHEARFGRQRNSPGLWVSLSIADDDYWVFIERDPVARTYGTQWIGWAAVALLLSIIGAILITRLINRPLAQLSRASAELGSGRDPAPLPETGPIEIRTVNESFNRMVTDLGKLDADRALLLAGISHDLRTPLSRLRLELEMAPLPDGTRAAMVGDIEQMDAIVRQFLDYARKAPQAPASRRRSDGSGRRRGAACAHRRRTRFRRRREYRSGVRIRGFAVETRSCARQSADQCSALRTRS